MPQMHSCVQDQVLNRVTVTLHPVGSKQALSAVLTTGVDELDCITGHSALITLTACRTTT